MAQPPIRCRPTARADDWERGHDAGIDLAVEVIRREVADPQQARRLVHELLLAARMKTQGQGGGAVLGDISRPGARTERNSSSPNGATTAQ